MWRWPVFLGSFMLTLELKKAELFISAPSNKPHHGCGWWFAGHEKAFLVLPLSLNKKIIELSIYTYPCACTKIHLNLPSNIYIQSKCAWPRWTGYWCRVLLAVFERTCWKSCRRHHCFFWTARFWWLTSAHAVFGDGLEPSCSWIVASLPFTMQEWYYLWVGWPWRATWLPLL